MEFLWAVMVSPFSTLKPSMGILRQYAVVSWFLSIIASLQFFWEVLDVQFLVMVSFSFQVLLILFTPLRKQTSSSSFYGFIWILYLLADFVAILAVTLIYKVLESTCEQGSEGQGELFAFWAQFLLLHLGGPDTITALALEDNELWLRTGLHLGTQAYAAMGVLVKSVQESSLWAPTILMFFAGLIKYLERVFSLFNARLTNSGEPLDQYAKLLSDHVPKDADVPLISDPSSSGDITLSNVGMVRDALYFFLDFKAHLYGGQQYKSNESRNSRNYFLHRTPKEAFRVLEIQLNFSYDAFYTKMIVIHQTIWKVFRHFVMVCEVACLVIWCLSTKSDFEDYDIGITYTLLIGAIAMDVYAFLRLWLSIWSIANVNQDSRFWNWFCNVQQSARDSSWWTRVFFRRWSESVPQFNLIYMYMGKRSSSKTMQKVVDFFGIGSMSEKGFSNHLRDYIFEYLKESSSVMSNGEDEEHFVEYFCYAKGNRAFQRMRIPKAGCPQMAHIMIRKADFDEQLIRWHNITEICYQGEINSSNGGRNIDVSKMEKYREISKTLSDYMMYLFVQHPAPMSTVTGRSKYKVQEACDALIKQSAEFRDGQMERRIKGGKNGQHQKACENLMDWIYDLQRVESPASRILEAYLLNHVIRELNGMWRYNIEKWEFVANVWMDLLCYAANRCKPEFHAVQVKQGGELLSFVWLLMTYFGFGLSEAEDYFISDLDKLLDRDGTEKGDKAREKYTNRSNDTYENTSSLPYYEWGV